MADFMRDWIMNITVIIIFVMLLDAIMPNTSMKRYINVIIGLLIIIAVIKPFVFVKDYADSFNNEYLEVSSFIDDSGMKGDSAEISKFQQQKAVEIFEDNLKSRIIKAAESSIDANYADITVDLELERDFEKEDFGNIKSITVSLRSGSKEVIEVDRIKISDNDGTRENKNVINKDKGEYNLNDSKISSGIKNEISKALGVSGSIVHVKVLQ